MNAKVLAIVAVAVVVVAAAGAGAFFLLKNKDKEPDADYTLLDSNDNIKVGMTIVTDTDAESMTSHAKYVVNAVANGKVTYSMKSETSGDTVLATFADFMPTGFLTEFPFDYTDSSDIPSGVTVTHNGNVYTIDGSFKENNPPMVVEYTFDDLEINYNGTAVTAVDGKMKAVSTFGGTVEKADYKFVTKDGVLGGTTNEEFENPSVQVAIADFYSDVLMTYNADTYAPATITSAAGTYGGVDVTVYTINGTDADGDTYENVNISVYKGFMLHGEGKMNGEKASQTTKIYIA